MFVSSWNHVVAYVGQSMISDFIFHGYLHWTFRRKQIIRTHLLSKTSSDYFCLVRVARIELTASWTPLCFSQKRNGHSDTTCTQYHQISKLFYHSVSFLLWSNCGQPTLTNDHSPLLSYMAQFRFSKIEIALFCLHELFIRRICQPCQWNIVIFSSLTELYDARLLLWTGRKTFFVLSHPQSIVSGAAVSKSVNRCQNPVRHPTWPYEPFC